jgi:hypothetical protein
MAIYGDGKHNENMEYTAPKFTVTDKVVYRTTHWVVETYEDTYRVQCQEGDISDTWFIESDLEGFIDNESELGQEIIKVCEDYEEFDMDGGYDG